MCRISSSEGYASISLHSTNPMSPKRPLNLLKARYLERFILEVLKAAQTSTQKTSAA